MSPFDDAVRGQHARLASRLAEGMPRAGWKICVNDARMQRKLGLDTSFVGFLEGARRLSSGGRWSVDEGSILGVEPEIALRFGRDVAAGDRTEAIRAAIEGAAPAIEVVDWRDARFDLATLAASSSFHAGFVVGDLRPFDQVPPIGQGCPRFARGEELLGLPDPDLVPADLLGLVARVAAFLGRFGQGIRAGDWLLSGACTNPARVEAGDVVEADFGGLGAVAVEFEG